MTENRTQKGENGGSIRDLIERRKEGKNLIPSTPYLGEKDIPVEAPKPKLEQEDMPNLPAMEPPASSWVAADFVDKILSAETRYENSRQTVLIDRGFKNILDILSQLSGVDISRILNNILREFLQPDGLLSIMPELEQYIQKQQRSISLTFKTPKNNG